LPTLDIPLLMSLESEAVFGRRKNQH